MNKPVVKFMNVTKTYSMFKKKSDKLLEIFSLKQGKKSFSALSGVSFEVYKGETIGIIGINGSGKSTLSSLLAQVTPPTSGDISIEGETSLVAISAGLNNFLTGMENIELKCMMHGLTKDEIEDITPTIIEFADIGEFINQPIKSYSSGMKSRLGFAISAHIQPDILVVDEALSVGDSTFYRKCLDKFDEFKKQGKTIFFISHSLSQVQSISDRILWLNFGRIKMFGNKDEVAKEYNTFIDWFNDLSKSEQKEYRKKMLATQRDVKNFISGESEVDITLQRRYKPKNKKQKKSRSLLLQFSLIFVMFVVSIMLLFVDNPAEAINNGLGQVAKTESNNDANEESNAEVLVINETGRIKERNGAVYLDTKLKNVETELPFATEVFVEEEIEGSIYKISIEDKIQGYIKSDSVEMLKEIDKEDLTLTVEDFLPLFPESVSESYAFLFAFINTDYENVKSTLQGLTDEYTDEYGNNVLVYEYGAYSYYFNEDNLSYAIKIDDIDLDSSVVNEIIEESTFSNNDESIFYFTMDGYEVILDIKERSVEFNGK
ncbi:hypothetical protein CHI07_03770 [Paenibacillus sp. 7884-2]|nr:hypothetical protein CHI07_03770 [Paenibacillus sp. 7884-2]